MALFPASDDAHFLNGATRAANAIWTAYLVDCRGTVPSQTTSDHGQVTREASGDPLDSTVRLKTLPDAADDYTAV